MAAAKDKKAEEAAAPEPEEKEPGTDIAQIPQAKPLAEMSEEEMLAAMRQEAATARGEMDIKQDLVLPGLVLVQATSGFVNDGVARPGQILQNLTHETFDEVEVIVSRMSKSRVLFPAGELGQPPECTSPNALDGYGDPGDALPQKGPLGGGSCETCPQANWREGGKCQLRYNYMGVLLGAPGEERDWEHELPVGFMMHGTSSKIATRLNSVLVGQDLFWDSTIVLSSAAGENDKGKFRLWAFKKGRPTNMAEKVRAFQIAQELRRSDRRVVVSGENTADPDGDIPF